MFLEGCKLPPAYSKEDKLNIQRSKRTSVLSDHTINMGSNVGRHNKNAYYDTHISVSVVSNIHSDKRIFQYMV